MARRRFGRKRGRPFDPNAKRHQTTRAGRRGDVDDGSPWLVARKLMLTGRGNIEMTAAGVLYGHDHLDAMQYDKLADITGLLQRIARGFGRPVSLNGLWSALLAASGPSAFRMDITGADPARRRLARLIRDLNGSRALVLALAEERVPPIVARVLADELTYADKVQLESLRQGLDALSR